MNNAKMMGFEIPGDQKVSITVREWNAVKLALWRSRCLSEITTREALELVARCRHTDGCPGAGSEAEPCRGTCPDREQRMSALVILNAARQLAPSDARKPAAEPYFAPSREFFSEVIAALSSEQIENELLREALRQAGIQAPTARNSNGGGVLPAQEPAQLAPHEVST